MGKDQSRNWQDEKLLMKTFLLAILMFTGLVVIAPDAEARRYYRDGRSYYSSRSYRGYYSSYRYPRRYYYSSYHRPYYYRSYYRPYYYRSYYRPRYYYSDYNCHPYGYGYYGRPGVSISFGF
jgi:hypothetical protein